MATANQRAKNFLRTLREIERSQGRIGGGSLPGAPDAGGGGGVDRATSLALARIEDDVRATRRALEPSVADDRSVL